STARISLHLRPRLRDRPRSSCHPAAALRPLHSFPTRRSSDLMAVYLASPQCEQTHEIFSAGGGRFARYVIGVNEGWFTPNGPASDRKSTRLNSSHVKISYAVFCLKKKRHTYRPSRQECRILTN